MKKAIGGASRTVAIGLLVISLCVYGFFRLLDHLDGDWNQPKVIFQDTNVTNPDLASLENCEWKDRSLVVLDDRKAASFGYLVRGKYFHMSFDPSENLSNDDSTNHVSINNSNECHSAFPTPGPQPKSRPPTAKFLRKVQ